MAFSVLDTLTLASVSASQGITVFAKIDDNTAYYCRGDEDGQAGFVDIDSSPGNLTKTIVNASGARFYDFCYLSPGKPSTGGTELVVLEFETGTPVKQYLRRLSLDPVAKTITQGARTANLYSSLPDDTPTDYTHTAVAFTALDAERGYVLVKITNGANDEFYQIPWSISGMTVSLGSAALQHQISSPSPPATYYEPINAFGVGGGNAMQFWLFTDTTASPDSHQLYWGIANSGGIGTHSNAVGSSFSSDFTPPNFNEARSIWRGEILRPSKVLAVSTNNSSLSSKLDTMLSTSSALATATAVLDSSINVPYAGAAALWIAAHRMGGRKFVLAHKSGSALYISEATINTAGDGLTFGDSLQIDSNVNKCHTVFHFDGGSKAMVLGEDNDAGLNEKVWLIGGLTGLSGASDFYAGQGALTRRFTTPFDRVSPYGMSLNKTQGRLVIGGLVPLGGPIIFSDYPYGGFADASDNLDDPDSVYPVSSVKWV